VSSTSLDFGGTVVNSVVNKTLTVKNLSAVTVSVSVQGVGESWEEVRSSLYSGMTQAYDLASQALNEPGLAFFADPTMSVLMARFQDLDIETVEALRNLALEKAYLQASVDVLCLNIISIDWGIISIGGVNICLSRILDVIAFLTRSLQGLSQAEADQFFNADLPQLQACAKNPDCDFEDKLFDLAANAGLSALLESLRAFLLKVGVSDGQAITGSILFLEYFFEVVPAEDVGWLIARFGPVAVVAVSLTDRIKAAGHLDSKMIHPSLTQFPYPDIVDFFKDLKPLLDYAHQQALTCDNPEGILCPFQLGQDLVNLVAFLSIYAWNGNEEGFYRMQATVQLARQVLDQGQGWVLQRLAVDLEY
jgi:hypothetical protein